MTQSGEREFNRGKLARLEKWVTCYLSKQVWKTVFLLIWECDGISRGERLTENQFGKLWFWGVFGGPKTSEPGCKCCSVGFWDLRLTATAPPRDQKVRAGFRSTPSQVIEYHRAPALKNKVPASKTRIYCKSRSSHVRFFPAKLEFFANKT